MRADLHVHTEYSNDGKTTLEELVEHAIANGIGCVAVTDHNVFEAYSRLKDDGRIIVIPAEEVSSAEGHIVALGIDSPIPRDLSIPETIEAIHDAGGYAFAAHPYRWWSGLGEKNTLEHPFDGVEARNARSVPSANVKSEALAKRIGKPVSAGSDAHTPRHIGDGYVEVADGLETWEEVLAEIMASRAVPCSRSRRVDGTLKYGTKSIGEWMLRGFKRMRCRRSFREPAGSARKVIYIPCDGDPLRRTATTDAGWTAYGLAVFAVMSAAYFFVYFHRVSLGVMGGGISADTGVSTGMLSAVYFWTYAAMQVPSGLIADKYGPRAAGTAFLSLAAFGSLVSSFSAGAIGLVAGKIMIAAGMAVVYVPLMKAVSSWFPEADFAVLNGVVIAVGNIGAMSAAGPLHMLCGLLGWRSVFLVLALVTGILAALCLAIVRDSPRETGSRFRIGSKGKVLPGLMVVASSGRRFWACALSYFLVYGSIMTFQGTWAAEYLSSELGFVESAAWMVTMIGVGKILSSLVIGYLATSGRIGSKKRAMALGTFCFASVWGVIAISPGMLADPAAWFAVCFLFGFFGGFMTLSFAQVKEWHPGEMAGTAVSAMNVFLFLGASVCVTVSSFLVDPDPGARSFSELWILMFVLSLAAAALVLLSAEKGRGSEAPGRDRGWRLRGPFRIL